MGILCMKKGFTLVELLVVATIIAVLSAVAIPAFTGYIHRSADKVCSNMAAQVLKTVVAYTQNQTEIPANTYDLPGINAILGNFAIHLPDHFTAEIVIMDKDNITVIIQDVSHIGVATVGS
jgi:prepilin-type N-terminal cleavage/methylation domain-containing protein